MDTVVDIFTKHGILGAIILVLGLTVRSLYHKNQALHKEYQEKLDAVHQKYVEKNESWITKSHELVEHTNTILDAVMARKR